MANHQGARSFSFTADGQLARRQFLATAAQLGLGLPALSGLGAMDAWAQSATGSRGTPLTIGWIRPVTGLLAPSFFPLFIGGLIAVDEINATGGIMGRPIERLELDDEGSPAKQPEIVSRLQDKNVSFVVGPNGSSQALASFAGTMPAKIIQAAGAIATTVGDGNLYPYNYQCGYNTELQGQLATQFLVKKLGMTKIGILVESTAYGDQVLMGSRNELERLGIKPVSVQSYPVNATDFNGYITNLRNAGTEGLLAWVGNIPNAALAFTAMANQKWAPPTTGHYVLFLQQLLTLIPAEALTNVYGTMFKNLTWTDTEKIGDRQIRYAQKVATYKEAKGLEVVVASAPWYDFLHLLKTVIEAEKTFDTARIKRALDTVTGYQGMLGTYSFTSARHTGIGLDDMVMASVVSATDPKAMGLFRKRA